MPKPAKLFSFPSPVLREKHGMFQHYLPIPDDISEALLKSGTRRIVGSINDFPIRRAIHRRPDGQQSIVLSKRLLRDISAVVNDIVEVQIQSDPEPNRVDIEPVFADVLEMDPEAADQFQKMTPGMQRSLMVYIDGARRVETKLKRSLEIAEKLRTRTLYGDRQETD